MYESDFWTWSVWVLDSIGLYERASFKLETTNQFFGQKGIVWGGLATPCGIKQDTRFVFDYVQQPFDLKRIGLSTFIFAHAE